MSMEGQPITKGATVWRLPGEEEGPAPIPATLTGKHNPLWAELTSGHCPPKQRLWAKRAEADLACAAMLRRRAAKLRDRARALMKAATELDNAVVALPGIEETGG